MNDSLFLEVWRRDVVGRVTAYEHSPDMDIEAFSVPDGLNVVNTHLTDTAEFYGTVQTLFHQLALGPALEQALLAALPAAYRPVPALRYGG